MKCIILKNNLIEALTLVERATGFTSNLPILKNILVNACDGKIVITATNLEIAVEHTLSGKILEEGECAFPCTLFSSIIKNIPSERITIESNDLFQIVITTDNYDATIQGQDAKDFPPIPPLQNKGSSITMPSYMLKDALGAVFPATHYSEIRPEISGVYVHYKDEGLVFVATDSFRLAEKTLRAKEIVYEGHIDSFIIPFRAVEEIVRIFNQKEELVILEIDTNQIILRTANTRFVSRLIDGRFPDYQAIIPKETKGFLTINREELINAIKLTSSLSGKANDIALRMGEHGGHIELYSRDASVGENHYRVPIKQKGNIVPLMFNWKYLLDGLKIYTCEEITLGMTSSDRPVSVIHPSDASLLYIVMPLRL